MRIRAIALLLLVVLLAPTVFGTEDVTLRVPAGSVPVLDGSIGIEEWSDALAIALDEESSLYLKHSDGYVYLAVQATTMGIPSPLVLRGDDVHVLHASAALGTAIYSQQSNAWVQTQAFLWQCRSPGFGEAAVAERERFLEQEGWLGTIGYLGARTQFEYKIRIDEPLLRMLFLFMEATHPARLLSWPVAPETVGEYLPLITGPIPSTADFNLDRWATLIPSTE